jgi:parallel beta-helix repeat protein
MRIFLKSKIKIFLIIFLSISISLAVLAISQQSPVIILIYTDKVLYDYGDPVSSFAWLGFSNFSAATNLTLTLLLMSQNSSYEIQSLTDSSGFLNYTFANLTEGNYTLIASFDYNNITYSNFTVFNVTIPIEKINFQIFSDKSKYAVNETVKIYITGPYGKEFILAITGKDFLENYTLKTDENGNSTFSKEFMAAGNYTITVENANFSFEVFQEELPQPEQPMPLQLEVGEKYQLGESVNIEVFGKENSSFSLFVRSPLNATIYSIQTQTDEKGKFLQIIPANLSGLYEVELISNNISVKKYFSVEEKELFNILTLELKQGKAEIGKPVEWTKVFEIENFQKILELNLSMLEIPAEARFLSIEDEEGNILSNQTDFILEIPENRLMTYSIHYETPSPVKNELPIEIYNKTWMKKIILSSNCSLTYENVSVASGVEEGLENITLLKGNKDVTNDILHSVSFLDLDSDNVTDHISWVVPELKDTDYTISATTAEFFNISNYTCRMINSAPFYADEDRATYCLDKGLESKESGIILKDRNNVVLDCSGNEITGKFKEDSYGIYIENSNNVEIKNCRINHFEVGLQVENSSLVKLINNVVQSNTNGIIFYNSNYNDLYNNTATKNSYHGVLFYSSFNNTLQNNEIESKFGLQILIKLKNQSKNKYLPWK